MKEIFDDLRKKRIELGYSVDKVAKETRLSSKIIKSIDNGEIDFFKDDISYLRFYVKAYAECVGIEYNTFKDKFEDEIIEYTSSIDLDKINKRIEEEKKIKERAEKSKEIIKKNAKVARVNNNKKAIKKKSKIDFSLISMIAVIIIIVVLLAYSIILFVNKDSNEEPIKKPANNKPQVVEPNKPDDKDKENKIEIKKQDRNTYIVSNLKDIKTVELEIYFGSYSWFQLKYNDVVQATPESKVYNAAETIKFTTDVVDGKSIKVRLGRFEKSTFKVNGIEVPLDDTLKTFTSADEINIILKGE